MTPHIKALKEDIAKDVIMPGDPMRAKFIAEKYLKDYKLINDVRGMLGYTGYYKDKKVTVMGSGMGMPSVGIYSYELFKFYDVENIIRVGSCGSYIKELNLYDLIIVDGSYSDSTYAYMQNGCKGNVIKPSHVLTNKIKAKAKELNLDTKNGLIYSSDVFYKENDNFIDMVKEHNVMAVEMETFALFHNANVLNKNASAILTVSDNLVTKAETSSEEREKKFTTMIELALESIL